MKTRVVEQVKRSSPHEAEVESSWLRGTPDPRNPRDTPVGQCVGMRGDTGCGLI